MTIAVSPSGKARDFDSLIRMFDSYRRCQSQGESARAVAKNFGELMSSVKWL